MVWPLWKTVWRFLKKLKKHLPYDSVILLLGLHPAKTETLILTDTCTSTFTVALLSIAIQVSINGQIYEEMLGWRKH